MARSTPLEAGVAGHGRHLLVTGHPIVVPPNMSMLTHINIEDPNERPTAERPPISAPLVDNQSERIT
jgi:hypothetical protein